MIRGELAALIHRAAKKAQRKGDLPKTEIPEIVLERPKRAEHGDYACSLPLKLVAPINQALKAAGKPTLAPIEVAKRIAARLDNPRFIGRVEVAAPGFVNITLAADWLAQQVEAILDAGDRFGNVELGGARRVQVEFGSANPTGPMHVGFARNLALGDTLARVLEAAGYDVQREYYLNDAGTQLERFAESLYIRYCGLLGPEPGPLPGAHTGPDTGEPPDSEAAAGHELGYRGQYVIDWAREILEREGDRYLRLPAAQAVAQIRDAGLRMAVEYIRADCARMNIQYDNWFSERSLYLGGVFDRIMALLREGDHLAMRDGAVWFNARALGADKDEVVIRSNGQPGYFASDIAYHYDKFVVRGFAWVIDVWGADHQGHVPRMKAMMQALGLDPGRLTLYIYQLVTLLEKGEQVRLSKRAGTQVDLRELMDDIGPDAVRFLLISRTADSQMDLDLDLARKQSDENPVYYVQYGHARIASILRYADEQGHVDAGADVGLLTHPAELALIRKLLELPEIVTLAARELAPHHLPRYAQELAATFHAFYRDCRVVSSDPADEALTRARLRLAKAVKRVLGRTLNLMGVAAPERM